MEVDEGICRCEIINRNTFAISILTQTLLTRKVFDFLFDGRSNKNLSFRMWQINILGFTFLVFVA